MVRYATFYILIILLFSCAEDPPIPEEIEGVEEKEETEEVREDLNRIICEFDLSQVGDDLPLFGDWEFAGFQHLETGDFHHYTCFARWAHLTHYQGGFNENMDEYYFPLYLKLIEEKWQEEGDNCSGKFKLESRTHQGVLRSCFSVGEQGEIKFEVELPYWEFGNSTVIFPEENHHIQYSHGLETATSYEIEANRLYVNYDSEVYRMVFVELVEEDE